MLRSSIKSLLPFLITAIVVIVTVWVIETSQAFQKCIGDYYSANPHDNFPKSVSVLLSEAISYRTCVAFYLIKNNPVITAIGTAAIAAFTLTLWLTSNRQARLIEQTLVADKRAFVFASSFTQMWTKDANTGLYSWQFRPVLRNSGDTPTKQMRMYVTCEILDSQLPNGYAFTPVDINIATGTIPPKFELQGGVAPADRLISPQDIVDCQNNRRFIYLWGWVEYNDVFPRTARHITKYCWSIHITGDPYAYIPNTAGSPPTPGTLNFTSGHHREGNCIDEECLK